MKEKLLRTPNKILVHFSLAEGGKLMRRKRLYQLLLLVSVIGLMAVIFAFSAQPGEDSDALTQAAAMPLAELMASMQDGADAQTVEILYLIIGTIVRKAAHLCEYALLGLLLLLLCRSYGLCGKWLPILIAVAYAASDEWHQSFVPGRLGTPVDVLIDAIGAFGGVYTLSFIPRFRREKHVYDP